MPWDLTKLIFTYITIVIPFHKYICPEYPRNGYLFPDGKGSHWGTPRQTKIMNRESQTGVGFTVGTQSYRQLQVAFDREYVRMPVSLPEDDGDASEEEESHISDIQAVHSSRIARNHYGRTGIKIDAVTTKLFRDGSDAWQKWMDLLSRPQRQISSAGLTMRETSSPLDRSERVIKALEKLYGPNPKWSMPEQEEGVYAILDGISPLVCILPTGGGKTALLLIPVMLDSETKTSIVITPYIELANDLKQQCQKLKISCIRWTPGTQQRARIVIVVVDTATSGEFILYARDLYIDNLLSRTFIDECHTLITEKHFRPKLERFSTLCLGVAVIYLTATFPPGMKNKFEDDLRLTNPTPTYIRASTNRKNVQYEVITVPDDQHIDKVCQLASETAERIDANEKVLIFCSSTKQVEDLAGRLLCCKYYSKYSEKEGSILRWKDGIHKIMVSTSALSAGMNVRGVVLVIHVGETYGCSSFVQESGRGGRERQLFKAITIMAKSRLEALKKQDPRLMTQEAAALREFIIATTNCRRGPISEFQDGKWITCKEIDAAFCDICDSGRRVDKRPLECESQEGVAMKKLYSRAAVIAESVAEERVLIDHIQSQKRKLRNKCSICWAWNRGDYGHEQDSCSFKEFGIGQGMKIKCENDSCCFRCGLPGDLCEDYESRTCTGPNLVQSLVTIHLERNNESMWNCLKEISGQEFDLETRKRKKELEKWLGQKCRTMGENGNNMFAVYCLAIKNGVDFK